MNYDAKLNELAQKNVSRGEYQLEEIDSQIGAKHAEKGAYLSGKREEKKAKHLEKLKAFDDGIDSLISQRNDAIKTVDDQYIKDIEAYKATDDAKWDALAIVADDALKNSEWMLISDSTLTTDQKTIAKVYRKSIMDLKKNYGTADEAIAAFESLEKPDYKLW